MITIVSTILITCLGLIGIILHSRHLLITLLCIELAYLGTISSFTLFGSLLAEPSAFLYSLLLLVVAASESAVGLGILLVLFRFGKGSSLVVYNRLVG